MNADDTTDFDFTHFFDVVLRRRWIVIAVALVISIAAALRTFTVEPVYQSSALLVIEKEQGGGALYAEGASIENTQADYYQTQYILLKSYSLLDKVYTELNLDKTEDFKDPDGREALEKAVKIVPVRRSRLVRIQVDSHDAGLTALIANSLARNFVNQNLSNQLFISQDILRALKSNPDTAAGKFAYESLPDVVNNELIQKLKIDYATIQAQAADLSRRYTARHPAMASLSSNAEALKLQIKQETDRVVQSLKTKLSGQLKGNNVRIVDAARIPEKPYRPRKLRALIIGMIMGMGFGLAIAFIVELLDQSIRNSEDIENKLGMPSLGLVPFIETDDSEPVYATLTAPKLSLTSEAFRNIRTMVDLAAVSDDSKTFMVTSAVQEEGKTYVASNLSVALSQLGGSVLLIDGDMRRPKIHKNFRLTAQHGLSEFLANGKDISQIEPLIQKTQIPNLSALVCGPRPPNPSELLNTPRVGAILEWARSRYDRIIVDCPPMFPINDTLLWGRHIKSTVFVVRYGKTRVPLIKNANKNLLNASIKILGIAVNAAKPGGLTYSGYGYYYQQYYRTYAESEPANK